MKNKNIEFRDPVVERVVDKFINRSNVGFKKYGSTLHDERTKGLKDLSGYLNDVQEELMDAILYIQAAKEAHEDMKKQLDADIAIAEVNKASFRPPHPSHASNAQLDWDDAIAPV